MSTSKFDPTKPYRYVTYLRMSSKSQNKRSPEQQQDTIVNGIARQGYPWVFVQSYRDDAISGRYVRKRPDLQRMFAHIEAGLIHVDLIVVDTLERFGRAEEMAEKRRMLEVQYGVLIVAADNGFADPTGIAGKSVGLVEQIRTTENTRTTRHNVIRGKRDAVKLGRWPGGPPPFGYRLKTLVPPGGSLEDAYSVLEPDTLAFTAMQIAFRKAIDSGFGDSRLTSWWNKNPEIPKEFKPISPFTMGYRLTNEIYASSLEWGHLCTAVVNDTRVVAPNPDEPQIYANFCVPVVSKADFDQLQALRAARAAAIRRGRKKTADGEVDGKLIAPQAPGLTLKYLLTGLVRCGMCAASMRPVPSGRTSKAGRKYCYYTCPRHYEGACTNSHHVPEDRLRAAVVSCLRFRLFPAPNEVGQIPGWYVELDRLLRKELQRLESAEPSQLAAARDEIARLERQLAGWSQTLADPELATVVRNDIGQWYAHAKGRATELGSKIAADAACRRVLSETLRPAEVLERLRQLDQVLGGNNPTRGNLELAKHIAAIACFPDGRVEMRGTHLGLFGGAIDLLSRNTTAVLAEPVTSAALFPPVKPRLRGRLAVPSLSSQSRDVSTDANLALDPERFAGLAPELFWTEDLLLETTTSWSEANADAVAKRRGEGLTHQALAEEFRVTPPTIRHALRIAKGQTPDAPLLPKKMPRARWPEQHYQAVAALRQRGRSMQELCDHFGRSEPLIRTALRLAEQHRQSRQAEGDTPESINPTS